MKDYNNIVRYNVLNNVWDSVSDNVHLNVRNYDYFAMLINVLINIQPDYFRVIHNFQWHNLNLFKYNHIQQYKDNL